MVALSTARSGEEVVKIPLVVLSSLEVAPLGLAFLIVVVSSVFGRVELESTWKPGNDFGFVKMQLCFFTFVNLIEYLVNDICWQGGTFQLVTPRLSWFTCFSCLPGLTRLTLLSWLTWVTWVTWLTRLIWSTC